MEDKNGDMSFGIRIMLTVFAMIVMGVLLILFSHLMIIITPFAAVFIYLSRWLSSKFR